MTHTVERGQSLADIAVQRYGDLSAVKALLAANSLDVDDALQPGQVLELPEASFGDTATASAALYAQRGWRSATAAGEPEIPSGEFSDDFSEDMAI